MVYDKTSKMQRKVRLPSKKKKSTSKKISKPGEESCGIKECENFADKHLGGRSISINDAEDIWGKGKFEERKRRVRICKKCYRTWKKETKDDREY